MNSPVEIPFNSFIKINRKSEKAIYLQLADEFAKAIQLGYLPSGTKLPGSRQLSSIFNLHRNTIVACLQELELQGWIKIIPNKGSYILTYNASYKFQKIDENEKHSENSYPKEAGFHFEKSILLDNPYESYTEKLYLTDGIIDNRLAELKIPAKLYSSILKRKTSFLKINQTENEYFLKNLANYLNLTRGLHISKENIVVTKNAEMILYIISQMLLNKDDCVAITDLSYYKTNMIFQTKNVKIKQVSVDENGMDMKALKIICENNPIRIVFVTPHHHYPTTVTLSLERRIELINLSKEFGFIIIEYDYDFDFHYSNRPILPLASTNQNGMVIYIGKFGSYLASGYHAGFMIAPENFIQETKKHLSIINQEVDPFIEQVLGEMIDDGEINRILKKLRKIYKERGDYFYDKIKSELDEFIDVNKPSGGLAIWVSFKDKINLMQLKKICSKHGLFIPQTLLYQTKKTTSIRIGFGHLNFEEIDETIAILKLSILSLINETNDKN